MKKMTTYKHLLRLLILPLLLFSINTAYGQIDTMVNHDTVHITACQIGNGVIYDDGGPTGSYSNYFDGWVVIEANAGSTITLSGDINTESGYDYLTFYDGEVSVQTLSGTNSVNVTATSGRLKIYFHSDSYVTSDGFVLTWTVGGASSTCSNSVFALDTLGVTPYSISLTWSADNTAGPFIVRYNGQSVSGIADTQYTITGLNAAAIYKVSVIPQSDSTNFCCSDIIFVRTKCANVETPYFESFEEWNEGEFPDCWLAQRNFDDEDYIPQINTTHHTDGSRSLMLSCGGNNTADHFGMVATPPFEGTGLRSMRLKMMSSSSSAQLTIGLCDSTGSEYDHYGFVPLQTISVGSTWQEYRIDWIAPAPGKRLAFRMEQSMQYYVGTLLYIDGIGVESCGVDSLATSHTDFDRTTLSWSTFGSPTCKVKVRSLGATEDSLVFDTATSPLVITGLQSNKTYIFTVVPICSGGIGTARTVNATTTAAPMPASGYCSNFAQSYGLPTQWTYNSNCFSRSNKAINISPSYSSYTSTPYMASERLLGLAGHRVAITYSLNGYSVQMHVGTTYYADELSSLSNISNVSLIPDGNMHTAYFDIPASDTNRHLAIGVNYTYYTISIYSVEIGDSACMIGDINVIHRRGTSIELEWDGVYDTVIVQSCQSGIPFGMGQLDTFYNARRGTVHNLTTYTDYNIYAYRPCGQPCVDRYISVRTAHNDYPLPYCEDFSYTSTNSNYLGESYNDWRDISSVNNCPRFSWQSSSQYEDYSSRTLEMASWGFSWSYYSLALLPDIEIDSNTYISFYLRSTAPTSYLQLHSLQESQSGTYTINDLDTIHITTNNRHHYCYKLDTWGAYLDNRIGFSYKHPYEYQFYRGYIDELHFAHTAYGNIEVTGVGYDSVALSLDTLYGTDSVLIRLEATYTDTIERSFGVSDIGSIVFDSLYPNTQYKVFVQPYGAGCLSYACSFRTLVNYSGGGSGGGGGISYKSCFDMDDLLSSEIPTHWSVSGVCSINTNDEMQLTPGTTVAMHPMYGIGSSRFVFNAASSIAGDTLLLGLIEPVDTIPVDSASFSFDTSLFTIFDTLILDTTMQNYSMLIPWTAANGRIAFVADSGTVRLDNIGISNCPLINYTVKGNVITANCENLYYLEYDLHISDSAGNDIRTIHIDETPFSIFGLQYDMPYRMEVLCSGECTQVTHLRTESTKPLPYCVYFNQSYSDISIPEDWSIIKEYVYDDVRPSTSPGLEFYKFYSYDNQWVYVVLPKFNNDSALSVYVQYNTSWYNDTGIVQIGVMDNDTSTASFIPVYSQQKQSSNSTFNVSADLSVYANKRVAIRCRRTTLLKSLRVYGIPIAKYSLPHARTLRTQTATNHPYWLNINNYSYYSDTVMLIENNPTDININRQYVYLMQANDKNGTTCESTTYFSLGDTLHVPFCMNFSNNNTDYYNYIYNNGYAIQHNNSFGYNYPYWSSNGLGSLLLYAGTWLVLPELMTDSITSISMNIKYSAPSIKDTMVVGVMTDAYDTLSFYPIDTLVYTLSNGRAQNHFIDFAKYTDTGRWVALHNKRTYNNAQFMVHGMNTDICSGASSATVSLSRWNQAKIEASAAPFYVEYFPSWTSSQGDSSNTVVRIDSLPATITLNPETNYDFYFHCDSIATTCLDVQRIKTLTAPIDVPACIDFDTFPANTLPSGWTALNGNIIITNDNAHSGSNSLKIPIGDNAYIITPDANIDSIQRLAISLWYYTDDPADRLVVGVISDPSDFSTFYPIKTLASGTSGTWQRGLVEFSNAPGEPLFLVLRARSNRKPEGRSIYVDDIHLDTDIAFDLRVSDITSNSITLDWSSRGNPNVTVTVLDDTSVYRMYTNVHPPLLIEPLSIMHYYTFIFNSICSSDSGYCSTSLNDTLSVITPAPGLGCINATDLHSPQAVFFSGRFDNPYMEAGAIDYGSSHPDSRHTVQYDTAARDPRTGRQLRTIPEGYTSSVRLGNWSANYYEPEAEGVIYSLFVDTASFELLLLHYAAVLQDPIHAASDQPRFRLELLDSTFHIIDSACTSADFIADQALGWNTAADGVLWKDWTSVGIDLSAHADEQVYVRLTTYDCNEGSHYGYAYFTLECIRKNLNTTSCGDVATNTLSAPEGFTYRWYTSDNPLTISTEREITVPSQDITYQCQVSKLDNPACNFTISAYGGTRYPVATFDTSVAFTNFQFHVTFNNQSHISNDNINPLTGTTCETAYWNYGNGKTSTSYHGSTVYPDTGTYMVTLVSGIAADHCQDTATMALTLQWPDNVTVKDSIVCSDQLPITWNDSVFAAEGSKFTIFTSYTGTDSIVLMRLHVVGVPTVTAPADTTIYCGDTVTLAALHTPLSAPVVWYSADGAIMGSGTSVDVSPRSSAKYTAASFNTSDVANLVYNGNFESGNTGFASGYTFKANPATDLPESDYDICTDAHSTHSAFSSCGDHTSGHGNYMVVNGATTPNTVVWSQTVNVEPNTEYAFSAWVSNITSPGLATSVAYLQFMINGVQVGPVFHSPTTLAQWARYYEVWNSGSTTSATIAIVNQNTVGGGNDFGLDDISLAPAMCHVYDTVAVTVIHPVDTFVCENYMPLTWQGHTFATDSVAWDTLAATNGMDSIVRSQLHVKHNTSSTIYDTVVENTLPLLRFGTSFDTCVTDSLLVSVNTAGCDSIVTYNLHVHWNTAVTVDSGICLADLPLTWNTVTFDTSSQWSVVAGQWSAGSGSWTLTDSVTLATWGGADSVVTMRLTVAPNPLGTYLDTIVENQLPYNYRGTVVNGRWSATTDRWLQFDTILNFAASGACDSVVDYSLHVWLNRDTTLYQTICSNQLPYLWEGHTFTTADMIGTVGINMLLADTVTIPTTHGADSVMTLLLTVKPAYDTVDTIVVCPKFPFIYRDVVFAGPRSFDTVLLTTQDCDSVVHVALLPRDSSYTLHTLYSFDSAHWMPADTIIVGCLPDTLFLLDTTPGAVSYRWTYFSSDTTLSDTSSAQFQISNPLLTTLDSHFSIISIIVSDRYGCFDTLAWPIAMLGRPEAAFDWAPTNPPLHNPEARFINLTYEPDSLRYLWDIQSFGGGSDTSTAREPSYRWGQPGDDVSGDYQVRLTAYWDHTIDSSQLQQTYTAINTYWLTPAYWLLPTTLTYTCLDSTDNVITITNDFLQFPNLVTPNGDGNNDIWKVVNLVEFGEYSMNELWIFDRWGVLIYHVKNISTDADFWDPNATNSPDGTYYYRFQARSLFGLVKRNGLIEVLRN